MAQELIEYRRRRAENPQATPQDRAEYASLLLTCEPEDLRNPRTALPLVQEAVEDTDENNYEMLATLALAYQMTDDVDKNVETQRKAFKLLPPDPTLLRSELEMKLDEYLIEQGGYAEAEPLLLAGFKALTEREYVRMDDLKEALARLVNLYEAWDAAEPGKGYADKAARRRAKLAEAEAGTHPGA